MKTLSEHGLSKAEILVAELAVQGLTNKEIADKLFLSKRTVSFHITSIHKKMSVKTRFELIAKLRVGL